MPSKAGELKGESVSASRKPPKKQLESKLKEFMQIEQERNLLKI